MPYSIIHTGENRGYMHDATRPFLVVEHYHAGYKGGMRKMVLDRYTTRANALRAINRRGGTLENPEPNR